MHLPAVSNLNVMAWQLWQRMTMLGTVLVHDSYIYSTFIRSSFLSINNKTNIIYILGWWCTVNNWYIYVFLYFKAFLNSCSCLLKKMTILSDLTFLTKQLWMFRAWFSFIAWSHFWQTRSLFLAQFYTSRFTTAQSSCFLLAWCPLVSPWYLVTEFRSTILSPSWLVCSKIVTCKVVEIGYMYCLFLCLD